MHGFRCWDNIAPNAKCQRVFVLAWLLFLLHPVIGIMSVIDVKKKMRNTAFEYRK